MCSVTMNGFRDRREERPDQSGKIKRGRLQRSPNQRSKKDVCRGRQRDFGVGDMRTMTDLISELEAERDKFFAVALAVGFESSTTFVFADEADKLRKLNMAVAQGGEPVGLIGVVQVPGSCTIYSRALTEHKEDEWVGSYLERLCGMIKTLLRIETAEKKPGWVN